MSNLGTVNINKFFIAQVAPAQNQYLTNPEWHDAHGDRVRIRIPGKHPSTNEVKDENLPWAIVLKPTSHGNLNGGSCGLWGGEWVMACYLDESEQIPAIVQVLGNNLTQFDIRASKNGTTEFKRVDRFNSGLTPGSHQIIGDSTKPKGPAQPTKEEIKDATKDSQTAVGTDSDIQGATTLSAALARNAQREFRQEIRDAGFGQFLPGAQSAVGTDSDIQGATTLSAALARNAQREFRQFVASPEFPGNS